jgi:hypothetical protein
MREGYSQTRRDLVQAPKNGNLQKNVPQLPIPLSKCSQKFPTFLEPFQSHVEHFVPVPKLPRMIETSFRNGGEVPMKLGYIFYPTHTLSLILE